MKNDMLTDTENRIHLDGHQFTRFFNKFGDIQQCLPKSTVGIPCFLSEDHNNQFGELLCLDCNASNYLKYTLI